MQNVEWRHFFCGGVRNDMILPRNGGFPESFRDIKTGKAEIYVYQEDIVMAEEKVRFQMRIAPETDRKIIAAMPLAIAAVKMNSSKQHCGSTATT